MRIHHLLARFCLVLVLAGPAIAAAPSAHASAAAFALAGGPYGRMHVADAGTAFIAPSKGTHYVYVDDGNWKCPDSIEVFKISGTSATEIQTFVTSNACGSSAYFHGANALGYVREKGSACLILASPVNSSGHAPGSVLSYAINSSGSIAGQVSQIADPLGGEPDDVALSPRGKLVVVTTSNYGLSVAPGVSAYRLGAGCTLTLVSSAQDPLQYASPYISTVTNNHEVVSADFNRTSLDAFSLDANGNLAFQSATPAQTGFVQSDAADGTLIFAGLGASNSTTAEAGVVSSGGAVNYVPESPQVDPNGTNSVASWFDQADHNFVQGEEGSLGFYHASPFAFSQHVPLANSSAYPDVLQQTGKTLLVLAEGNLSEIEGCALTPAGSSGCTSIATLTNGYGAGLAVS